MQLDIWSSRWHFPHSCLFSGALSCVFQKPQPLWTPISVFSTQWEDRKGALPCFAFSVLELRLECDCMHRLETLAGLPCFVCCRNHSLSLTVVSVWNSFFYALSSFLKGNPMPVTPLWPELDAILGQKFHLVNYLHQVSSPGMFSTKLLLSISPMQLTILW